MLGSSIFIWVVNRVLETQFSCGRHVEKYNHIGPHQTIKIESQRLDLLAKIESLRLEMLVNNIVSKPAYKLYSLDFMAIWLFSSSITFPNLCPPELMFGLLDHYIT